MSDQNQQLMIYGANGYTGSSMSSGTAKTSIEGVANGGRVR